MMFLFLIMSICVVFVLFSLDKKILILLSLEVFFLSMIMLFLILDNSPSKISYFMFLLSLMMVADSVFALSVLVSCGRNSGSSTLKSPIF